ncbi:MAG: hypothetical protein ACRCWM_04800 [Sarcina sp.]
MEIFENKMTIFFYKRTGEIASYCTGIQTMNFFGEYKQEYELIMSCIVVTKDEFVLQNIKLFEVDINTKELIYKAPMKYKMR